ncbi:hypothetical protein MTP99_018866 [Tenebrio molitor]|uniref:uncharacterized protein n=1 Tax=Tenebrio molitor TaxID=7067 RepID=UPI001C3AC95F|nr:hypothetical protein MTP99_018866 [Tenebrio molitor]CAH1377476.1 unnamed protein product [Tenebrio molitor]
MGTRDHQEFKNALRDIAQHAHKLDSPFDRVRCAEWVRKLAGLPDDNLEAAKIRNEYAQFLRIQVCNGFLHCPFLNKPPTNNLISLAERLGDLMSKQIPDLPKAGPIAPVIHHRSPDGRAYVAAKQIAGGVLCYLAVSPDGLD